MLGGFSVLFEAPLEKVKIVTDDSGGLRLRPQENEETKQIVIIKKNGKVRVKRYSYRLEINGDRKFFDRTFKFDEEITQKILASIRDCFNNREGNIIGLDARPWTLDVTDENGRKNQLVGIVNGDESVSKISSYIRETLDLDYLWLFDGKDTKDEIKKVILETRHNLNNTIKIEKLIITAKEDKIEYSQKDNKGMKIVKTYVIPNKVKELLENYSFTNSFNRILGNPKDVIEPEEKRDYQLIIENSQNDRKIYVGTYDKYSLPTDWGDFIKDITNIISQEDETEIFKSSVYNRRLRRKVEYIICGVFFEGWYKEYNYLTDDESIQVGDEVEIPVGVDNHVVKAKIADVNYYYKEEAPYPIEKTKKILRKVWLEVSR